MTSKIIIVLLGLAYIILFSTVTTWLFDPPITYILNCFNGGFVGVFLEKSLRRASND